MMRKLLLILSSILLSSLVFANSAKNPDTFDVDDGVNIEGINRTDKKFNLEFWADDDLLPFQTDVESAEGGKSFHLISGDYDSGVDKRLSVKDPSNNNKEICLLHLEEEKKENVFMVQIYEYNKTIKCEVQHKLTMDETPRQIFLNNTNNLINVEAWKRITGGDIKGFDEAISPNKSGISYMATPLWVMIGGVRLDINEKYCYPNGRVRNDLLFLREDVCRRITYQIDANVPVKVTYHPRRLWDGKRFW